MGKIKNLLFIFLFFVTPAFAAQESRYLILSSAEFESTENSAAIKPFLNGVYAFNPVGWLTNTGFEQPNSTFYPPVTNFNTLNSSIELKVAYSPEAIETLQINKSQLKAVYWITHGQPPKLVEVFGELLSLENAQLWLRKKMGLSSNVEIKIFRCFMDSRGSITPPQIYVQDIWPLLIRDPELRHPNTVAIAERKGSGGTITIGDRVIVYPPK